MSRLCYSSSVLKSIRKTQPKQRLPQHLWAKLGDLGIRRKFRSRRQHRRHLENPGNPVLNTTAVPSHGEQGRSAVSDHFPGASTRKIIIPSLLICNAGSIGPKIDELDWVAKNNGVDAISITETWLSDSSPDPSFHDFTLLRKDRISQRGGGIAVFVREQIKCKRLPDLDFSESMSETMWLELHSMRLPRPLSSILLGVVYHPPSACADDNNVLYDHIQRSVDSYTLKHPDALICITGDFNPTSTNFSPAVLKRSCVWLTRDTGILDWYLTNHPKLLNEPKQLPKLGSSDHYCVLVQKIHLASCRKDSPTFHMWCNKVQRELRTCKQKFYQRKVKNLKDCNISRWWSEIKTLLALSTNNGQWFNQMIDSSSLDPILSLCEDVNNYCADLTLLMTPLSAEDVTGITVDEVMAELLATTYEVQRALTLLKVKRASGPDGIPNLLLKTFAFVVCELPPWGLHATNPQDRLCTTLTQTKACQVCQ